MKPLYLPALTGQFGNWRYFEVIMSVEEIVRIVGRDESNKPSHRIKLVSEVEEIYSRKGLGEKLQRVFADRRLQPIKNYLSNQDDKYINNLTAATFGGNPEWYPINLSTSSLLDIDEEPGEEFWEETQKSFGIMKLNGTETIFVLDGQHRVMGLREALKEDPNIKDQQIAITLISHEDTPQGRETTRRLFTTINRHAVPVSLGENILLDEDDLSAIIARNIIETYSLFKERNIIALNKTADIKLPKDDNKFTTVIQLWNINESLIDPQKVYPKYSGGKQNLVRIRPKEELIYEYQKIVLDFWDTFFESFPKAKGFIDTPHDSSRDRGGPLSLRPIGQALFCDFYKKMIALERKEDINLIKLIPDNLNTEFWHHVLLEPISKNIIGTLSYARNYLFYHLGIPITNKQLHTTLEKYRKYKNDPKAELPKRIID